MNLPAHFRRYQTRLLASRETLAMASEIMTHVYAREDSFGVNNQADIKCILLGYTVTIMNRGRRTIFW